MNGQVDNSQSFCKNTYFTFPSVHSICTKVVEGIEKQQQSEGMHNFGDEFIYETDPFFSSTALAIPFYSEFGHLDLKLDVKPLTSLSTNLPEELSVLSKNSQLCLLEKVSKATNYINCKYGTDHGWIWKTKKVTWDLKHLPFFLHLWSKPHLTKQAITFGIARGIAYILRFI